MPTQDQSPLPPSNTDRVADDHDSPWKEALEFFFPQAMALLAPDLYALIDWSVAPKFLDKELQSLGIPDGPHGQGRLQADKLVQVRLLGNPHSDSASGPIAWVLIHIEIQGGRIGPRTMTGFTHRMYRYRTRFEDRHEQLGAQAAQPPPCYLA